MSDVDAARWPKGPDSKIIVYYLTTDKQFHLQINELPGRPRLHQAAIGPLRYGIAPYLDWHPFDLFDDDDELIAEARRLKPFLDRQQFRDPVRRAAWKKAHPQFVLKSREK